MPSAFPVVLHDCSYKDGNENQMDATALRRGGSRSELKSNQRETPRGKPVALEIILSVLAKQQP